MPTDTDIATTATQETTEATPTKEVAPVVETKTDDFPWDRFATADPDELVRRNPRLAGKVGELAQKQARSLAARQMQEETTRQTAEKERQLRDEDPTAYVDLLKAREGESAIAMSIRGEMDGILYELHNSLPEEIAKELGGKRYDGSPIESRKAYLKEVIDRSVAVGVAKEKTKWHNEAKAAIKKEVLAELAGKEGTPDVQPSTGNTGKKKFTKADLANMSPKEYQEHRETVMAQLAGKA